MLVRPPPPLEPSCRLPFLLGDDAHAEAHERLDVARHRAVARDDEDLADLLGEARLDLDDARVVRVRRRRGALEQLRACRCPGTSSVTVLELVAAAAARRAWRRIGRRRRRRRSRSARPSRPRASSRPSRAARRRRSRSRRPSGRARPRPIETPREALFRMPSSKTKPPAGPVLEEEVGVVAAPREGDREELLGERGVDGRRRRRDRRERGRERTGWPLRCRRTYVLRASRVRRAACARAPAGAPPAVDAYMCERRRRDARRTHRRSRARRDASRAARSMQPRLKPRYPFDATAVPSPARTRVLTYPHARPTRRTSA